MDNMVLELSVCAPEAYPVSVSGMCVYGDGCKCDLRGGIFINNGIGYAGLQGNNDFNFIPDKIEIVWFSIIEKKTYHLKSSISSSLIKQLCESGYVSFNGELLDFNGILVAVFPLGRVAIYLAGFEKMVLLGLYNAEECDEKTITVDMIVPYSGCSDYEELAAKFAKDFTSGEPSSNANNCWLKNMNKTIESSTVSRYFDQFSYKIDMPFLNYNEMVAIIEYSNFEFEKISLDISGNLERNIIRPRIKSLMLGWKDSGASYTSDIFFDEDEIMYAFDNLFSVNNNKELNTSSGCVANGELLISISERNDVVSAKLVVGDNSYVFSKLRYRIACSSQERISIIAENFSEDIYKFSCE